MIKEQRLGAVAVVRMDEEANRNAISIPMRLALLEVFSRLNADESVRSIVFSGSDTLFSVGGDIHAMTDPPIGAALERMRVVHDLVRSMAYSQKPIVAAVEGWAVGGGLSLCLLCDTIVVSESTRFKAGFGEIGLIGDMGILHTLPARAGAGRARQILFYNETFTAAQAHAWGIADEVVPAGTALSVALGRAEALAAKPPLPISISKSILMHGLDEVLARERDAQAMLFNSADHREGKAAFLEKRKASFKAA